MHNLHGTEQSVNLPSPTLAQVSSYSIRFIPFFWIIPIGTEVCGNIFHHKEGKKDWKNGRKEGRERLEGVRGRKERRQGGKEGEGKEGIL